MTSFVRNDKFCYRWQVLLQMTCFVTDDRICYRLQDLLQITSLLQMTSFVTDDKFGYRWQVCYRWQVLLQMTSLVTDDKFCYGWQVWLQMTRFVTDDKFCNRWHVLTFKLKIRVWKFFIVIAYLIYSFQIYSFWKKFNVWFIIEYVHITSKRFSDKFNCTQNLTFQGSPELFGVQPKKIIEYFYINSYLIISCSHFSNNCSYKHHLKV